MGAKYQKYPEYKDSGVEWLGEIPVHWKLTKVKHITKCLDGARIPLNASERGEMSGDIPYWGANCVVDHVNDYLFDEELILIGEDGAPFFDEHKDVAFNISGKIWPNNHVHVLRPKVANIAPEFLKHALNRTDFHRYITGSTRDKLNQSDLNEIYVRSCPLPEQIQIAKFLDHETGKIDRLIEKQQELIALLKEKRQAVISHAVTKGLNPNAPLKPSNIEWLGNVPEHWEVTRAKFVSKTFVPQRNKPDLNESEGVSWVTMEDMTESTISDTPRYVSSMAQNTASSKTLPAGAVIASCVGNFGVSSINQNEVIINQQLQAYTPIKVNAEYLRELVSISKVYYELVGTAATLIYVNKEGFDNLPIISPPIDEQKEIVTKVVDRCGKFDKSISRAGTAITLLQERRTALISAAVTGKIDVRDWEPPKENGENTKRIAGSIEN